jgi:hypothetical protein
MGRIRARLSDEQSAAVAEYTPVLVTAGGR